ncbi:hypothetical protein ACFQX6_37155 [Streptosporangium lutulentum]
MSHTEHDLKETLAEHSEGGGGGTARLEEIIARGRRIRRRRRWAATGTAVAALAVVAVLTPVPLPGGGVTDARIAAEVREPEGEGVRLAGARFENVGKAETISFTPRSDRTSYRVSCAGPVQAFVRFGDQIDHSRCGNEQALGRHAIGRLEGTKEGITAKVEVFTVPDSQVPADITAEKELSSEDFDRVLAQARTGSGLWEIAIHDGGVSTRSCSPDICLYSGTTLATKGERNLASLPNSHSVRGGYFTETKRDSRSRPWWTDRVRSTSGARARTCTRSSGRARACSPSPSPAGPNRRSGSSRPTGAESWSRWSGAIRSRARWTSCGTFRRGRRRPSSSSGR